MQMGGWFRKEMKTMADWKGLKMRIPGLGGKVVAKAGGTVVLLPGGEIFTSLERGVVDAVEWSGRCTISDWVCTRRQITTITLGGMSRAPRSKSSSTKRLRLIAKDLQLTIDSVAAETNIGV